MGAREPEKRGDRGGCLGSCNQWRLRDVEAAITESRMGGSRDVMLQDVGEARGLVTSVAELIACGCLKEMRDASSPKRRVCVSGNFLSPATSSSTSSLGDGLYGSREGMFERADLPLYESKQG